MDNYMTETKDLQAICVTVWDSTAKSVEGILRGNVFQLGDFDECMTVRAPFSTQYCLVTVTANVPERYRVEDPFTLNHDPYGPVLHRIYVSIITINFYYICIEITGSTLIAIFKAV